MANLSRYADKANLRLPEGMRDRIQEAAKANRRSANAEIVERLESSFTAALPLNGEIAAVIGRYVDAEVSRRLRAIASQIGAA